MNIENKEIRLFARSKDVCLWQIAEKLEIAESTFLRWLRFPLSVEMKDKVIQAINEIAKEM